jgi:uncharacterized protein
MIEMSVTGVAIDIRSNVPLVILSAKDNSYTLPIWIGHFEAQSIAKALEGIEAERPMTHDLMLDFVYSLGADVDCIEINSCEESTFFASVILKDQSGEEINIDSRPSDAIAIALKTESPIYVSQSLLEEVAQGVQVYTEKQYKEIESNRQEHSIEESRADTEFKEFLKYIKASDFSLKRSE